MRRSFFHFQGVRAFKSCKTYPVRVRVMVRDMVSVRVRVRASVRVRVVLRRGLLRGKLKCAIKKSSVQKRAWPPRVVSTET